jgi:hypothetical protein
MALLVSCGSAAGEPVATDRCSAPENPPVQGGSHLLGDNEPPVPWNSVPPTSGWHASGAFDIGIRGADDPLTEARQVSVLEVGGVVVTYRDLPAAELAALTERIAGAHDGQVTLTPYDRLEAGEVAFTAWGVKQVCAGVDLEALDAFVAAYAEDHPDTPGAH